MATKKRIRPTRRRTHSARFFLSIELGMGQETVTYHTNNRANAKRIFDAAYEAMRKRALG